VDAAAFYNLAMSEKKPTPPHQRAGPRARGSYVVGGQTIAAETLAGGLYLVATPIGNLTDVTLRALETLAAADLIACEDTRVTHRLLERYGISALMLAYHDHNAASVRPKILGRLADGAAVALVSDAGTPLISDPGYKLVRHAQAAGVTVTAVPGPSSVLAALGVSGLPTDRFFFEGFLPGKQAARRARIAELVFIPATLVLFETGPRVADALGDLAEGFDDREAAVCRELTKLHEEVRRGTLGALAQHYAHGGETRGEFVIVVAPPNKDHGAVQADSIDELLQRALSHASLKDAVSAVAEATGRARRDIYQRALALTKARDATSD
jgi:16S rRNA (cytidine1402-2'-O)-methyltransferase